MCTVVLVDTGLHWLSVMLVNLVLVCGLCLTKHDTRTLQNKDWQISYHNFPHTVFHQLYEQKHNQERNLSVCIHLSIGRLTWLSQRVAAAIGTSPDCNTQHSLCQGIG